jgi:hypothetical protein
MYQSRSKIVGDEKGDLLADSHSVLNRWANHFCQLLNVCGFSDVRLKQTELSVLEATFIVLPHTTALKDYKKNVDKSKPNCSTLKL